MALLAWWSSSIVSLRKQVKVPVLSLTETFSQKFPEIVLLVVFSSLVITGKGSYHFSSKACAKLNQHPGHFITLSTVSTSSSCSAHSRFCVQMPKVTIRQTTTRCVGTHRGSAANICISTPLIKMLSFSH